MKGSSHTRHHSGMFLMIGKSQVITCWFPRETTLASPSRSAAHGSCSSRSRFTLRSDNWTWRNGKRWPHSFYLAYALERHSLASNRSGKLRKCTAGCIPFKTIPWPWIQFNLSKDKTGNRLVDFKRAHTYPWISIFVSTFIGTMYHRAACAKANHLN